MSYRKAVRKTAGGLRLAQFRSQRLTDAEALEWAEHLMRAALSPAQRARLGVRS